jgi:glycosyltransferase involved in cell wall biosynthesis
MLQTPLPPRPDLSVVVPLYDEEENVELLAKELVESLELQPRRWEILFIDDGSSDRTYQLLEPIVANDPRLRAIRLSLNFGQTAALQAGFSRARGPVVVTMDGDLQNDPLDIHRLVVKLDEGFDVVSGWRRHRKDRLLTRRIPSWCANWLLGRLTGVRLHDNGCALKAYRESALDRIDLYSDMHRFIPILLVNRGARLAELEVSHRRRRFGTSKYGLSRTWKVLLDLSTLVMITRFFNRPGQWFGLLSLPILLLGLLALGGTVYQYLTPVDVSPTAEGLPIVLPGATFLLAFAFVHSVLMAVISELIVFLGDESASGLPAGSEVPEVEEL